jgi:type III secretion protein O
MMSTYTRLRELKNRKAEIAAGEVRSCRLALEQAARIEEQSRTAAAAYSEHVIARQSELYDRLQERPRAVDELEDVRQQIAGLRTVESGLHKKTEEARSSRVAAAATLKAAQTAHLQAVKTLEKFDQLLVLERETLAAAEQLVADNEMEEFSRPGDPAGSW